MEQIILEDISKNTADKKVAASGYHGLTLGKSGLTKPTALYAEMTASAEAERAANVVYVGFDKAFDSSVISSTN